MKSVSLAEIAESIDYGVTASANALPVGPKFLRITDIQDDAVDWADVPFCETTKRAAANAALEKGDIVFARTGATTGKSFLIRDCPDGAVFASYLIRVRPAERVDPVYLSHFFQSKGYWAQVNSKASGAAQPGVNASKLSELEIPLPSLPEQRRIAGILDQAEALRRLRRQSLSRLSDLGQAIFYEMFGGLRSNPLSLTTYRFGEIAEVKLGKMLDKGKTNGHAMRPYLRNANVRWFGFDLSEVFEMEIPQKHVERFSVRMGDLLICEGGEPGRCAIWQGEDDVVSYQKALHRVRVDKSKIAAEFLNYWFYLANLEGLLVDSVTSATIAHLTSEKIKELRIALPPIERQDEFVARLKSVNASRAHKQAALDALDSLFTSLQHRAFRGEL